MPSSTSHVRTNPKSEAQTKTQRADTQVQPEKHGLHKLTDEMLAEIEWKLYHRPRKSHGYRTPLEYCKQLFNFDF